MSEEILPKIGDTVQVGGKSYLLVEDIDACEGCAFDSINHQSCLHPKADPYEKTEVGCFKEHYKFIEQ